VKPKEARHDADVYRLYQKGLMEIERAAARSGASCSIPS
jgi:hypothetical protein